MNAKISTKPKSKTKKGPLICTECGKTFRNAGILDAHLVHTHHMSPQEPQPEPETPPGPTANQVSCRVYAGGGGGTQQNESAVAAGTTKRKICIYTCPKCPVRFNHFSKIRHHLETVHGKNGGVMCQIKCVKCSKLVDPAMLHFCRANATKKHPDEIFLCGCKRNFGSWPYFQSHIPRYHRDYMISFFFPDEEHFERWKDTLCRSSGLSYERRRPLPDTPPVDGRQYFHCSHTPAANGGAWCPSAIVVTTFTNGLLVNYVAEHPGFMPAQYDPFQAEGRQYSLSAVRDCMDSPEEPGDLLGQERLGRQLHGLLTFVMQRLEGLDGKHLRSLYGNALGMITTINAQNIPVKNEPKDSNDTSRPINTMIGERVIRPAELKAKLKKDKKDPLRRNSDTDSADEKPEEKALKIGKVFSLNTQPRAKKAKAKRPLTEIDIEEEILNDVVKKKPKNVQTKNCKDVANDTTKSAVATNTTSYVDTFKDFIEKAQYGAEAGKTTWMSEVDHVNPRNCRCKNRPNCIHKMVLNANNRGASRNQPANVDKGSQLKTISVTVEDVINEESEDTEIKLEPDTDEITIEETSIGNLDNYEVMEQENDCNILILKI